ncbi:ATP-binding protein [Streptomyces sp. A3M-1-3]|uniref:AlbA family DNA-binding domain-containing protein n=1 Tax=Streptomyces sp. A3M-1-3 TaxID=2962044 RepID=UPI0020B761F0|nr:ATP-binding protein [Streptomyces sp. A3M-1-3]MCP3817896.1 ATP-binding protein [Streptomyces sp. A3M-1-3]
MTVKIPRIAALLGAPFEELDRSHLVTLCTQRVAESIDLDFKQQNSYAKNAESLDELAKDVTAMANARGGLIVIGIAEDAQGCAGRLTPVDIDDGIVVQFNNGLRSRVFPFLPPDFSVRTIPDISTSPGIGFFLIGIPRSPIAPHAVRPVAGGKGQNRYSYARRIDRITAWLDESEIAQVYRDRFRLAEDQAERVSRVLAEGAAWAKPTLPGGVQLELALVPNGLAERRIDRSFIQDVTGFLNRMSEFGKSPGRALPQQLLGRMPDVRRGRMHMQQGGVHAVWHTDGSAFASIEVASAVVAGQVSTSNSETESASLRPEAEAPLPPTAERLPVGNDAIAVNVRLPDVIGSGSEVWRSSASSPTPEPAPIAPQLNLTLLESEILGALHLITTYADWADGFGDVDILARTAGETTVFVDRTPINGSTRFVPPPEPFAGLPSEPSHHVAYLAGLVEDSRQLRGVARNIAADLLADYGVYELTLLRPNGEVRAARLAPKARAEMEAWLASGLS